MASIQESLSNMSLSAESTTTETTSTSTSDSTVTIPAQTTASVPSSSSTTTTTTTTTTGKPKQLAAHHNPIEARQEKLKDPLPTSIISQEKLAHAQGIIDKDVSIKPFWVKKYKNEAAKNWDKFYKRNETRFYKDRHWIEREFSIYKPQDLSTTNESLEPTKLIALEVGCGVGNFVFPVLELNQNLFMYACDFSPHAISLVKSHENYSQGRCQAFVCDLTIQDSLLETIQPNTVDIVSSIFCLSAIPVEKLDLAVKNMAKVMKIGGMLCFRDYAIYDAAQVKFSANPGHKLDTNLYVRQDGTLSLFMSKEQVIELFARFGLEPEECEYVHRETINRAMDISIDRRFLQAKFIKRREVVEEVEDEEKVKESVDAASLVLASSSN